MRGPWWRLLHRQARTIRRMVRERKQIEKAHACAVAALRVQESKTDGWRLRAELLYEVLQRDPELSQVADGALSTLATLDTLPLTRPTQPRSAP